MAMVMVSISLQEMIVMAALGVELGTKLSFKKCVIADV